MILLIIKDPLFTLSQVKSSDVRQSKIIKGPVLAGLGEEGLKRKTKQNIGNVISS